ncbi:hypothetical protein [Burkholderia sp. BCC1977]|uniref:hypothetical protein n=1 Tax=Burkholderia sp. BCC1977 TaxID=2817440 RepID=UPI002ABE05EF|nr:hypothetical protein [Burkholderia sp. BCC1977]
MIFKYGKYTTSARRQQCDRLHKNVDETPIDTDYFPARTSPGKSFYRKVRFNYRMFGVLSDKYPPMKYCPDPTPGFAATICESRHHWVAAAHSVSAEFNSAVSNDIDDIRMIMRQDINDNIETIYMTTID